MKNLTFAVAGSIAIAAAISTPVKADPMGPDLYFGAFGGGVFYRAENSFGSPYSGTLGTAGLLGGVRLPMGNWFFGGEVDGGLSFGQGVDSSHAGCTAGVVAEWCRQNGSMHARAVVGHNFNGVNIFAAAGLAAAFMQYRDISSMTQSRTIVGYSVGAGVEFDATKKVSVRAEVLHDGFGTTDFGSGYTGKWSQNTVRAAAIFHFNN